MLWKFKNKNTTETENFFYFIAKVSLLTTKTETGFQSFILAIYHWEINPDHSSDLDKNALREFVQFNLHRSTWELALDLNTFQFNATWKR